jgi:hypothetical protein
MYNIKPYSLKKAEKLGVTIKPSKNKNKKIDVYKNDTKITSIGAAGMGDYPTYLQEKGRTYANARRRLYKARHSKDKGLAGMFTKEILW